MQPESGVLYSITESDLAGLTQSSNKDADTHLIPPTPFGVGAKYPSIGIHRMTFNLNPISDSLFQYHTHLQALILYLLSQADKRRLPVMDNFYELLCMQLRSVKHLCC